ncbi:unnamed protein product [Plutella xylostella]|uniref:Lipase n=1 Tax=Plutella xylostella TaxID=51655 RepID=A0A8S4G501_PLUXY|nr:unnamed protein product [Plutella xylostella]
MSSLGQVFESFISNLQSELGENDPTGPTSIDTFLNATEICEKYGYEVEEHTVTTEDGYMLTLHRVLGTENTTSNGKVVLLMHGIMDSADSWVLQGKDQALAFILADEGFDVWMGNARGNKYSLQHKELTSKQSEFWEFTWEEIGLFDLPAMIDHILNITEKEKLYYVGHSQGTTAFFVMTSLRPEYNRKVSMMFALAPVAWMKNAKSPLVRMFSPAYKILGSLLSTLNTFSLNKGLFNEVLSMMCSLYDNRCENTLFMITGSTKNINASMLPVILGHMPTGSSAHQFVHYGQLVLNGRFCRYDFGEKKNMEYYNSPTPPDYDLSQVSVPVSMFAGGNDWLSDPTDVNQLKTKLPNVFDYKMLDDYSHLDFLYASLAKHKIYYKIITQIRRSQKHIF